MKRLICFIICILLLGQYCFAIDSPHASPIGTAFPNIAGDTLEDFKNGKIRLIEFNEQEDKSQFEIDSKVLENIKFYFWIESDIELGENEYYKFYFEDNNDVQVYVNGMKVRTMKENGVWKASMPEFGAVAIVVK